MGRLSRTLSLSLPLFAALHLGTPVVGAADLVADPETGAIIVKTRRYEARFEDGTLVYLHNTLRGRTMIDRTLAPEMTAELRTGLYVLQPDFYARFAEAEDEAAQRRLQPFWIHPAGDAAIRLADANPNRIAVTFVGLTSGTRTYPQSELTVTVTVAEETDDLLVRVSGRSPETLVVGSSLACSGLIPRFIDYNLGHSGLRQEWDFTATPPPQRAATSQWSNLNHGWRCGLGGGLWPAPVTVQADLDVPNAAFAVWAEDDVPYSKYLVKNGRANAYVTYSNPPYKDNHETASVPWRVNVYANGWTAAAAPFANSMKRRGITENRASWAQDISLILFGSSLGGGYLEALKDTFPPACRSKIIIWLPQAWRAMKDTKDPTTHDAFYWDNTFSEETAAQFKAATDAGFRISVYTNPHFNWGNYDKVVDPEVREIVKGFAEHRLRDPISGRLMKHGGNNIAYTPYREHMLNTYRKIHEALDVSIYLDTTHQWQLAPELVTGLTNYEGARKLFQGTRALKRDQFLGTENLNELAIMSGGCDYGLFFDLVWSRGWEESKARNTHPILGFLYRDVSLQVSQRVSPVHGPRYYHLAEEISERIGTIATGEWTAQGQAPVPTSPEGKHWLDKLRLYAIRGLRPFFPDTWEPGVMSYLRADDGQVFVYQETDYGSRFIERDVNGQDRLISARAWKQDLFKTGDGFIHDWLGQRDDGTWIGLDSVTAHPQTGRGYVLFPIPDDSRKHLRINALPAGVAIKSHAVTPDIADIQLSIPEGASESGSLTLVTDQPILRVAIDGAKPLMLETLGAAAADEYRYRLSGGLSQPFALIWTEGVFAAYERTDDFLMPATYTPGTKEIRALLGPWDQKWNSDLIGPKNPRPGTIYAYEVTGRQVGEKPGGLTAFLTTPSTMGGIYYEASGNLTFGPGDPQSRKQAGIRNTSMQAAWCRASAVRLYSAETVEVTQLSPVRFIRPTLGLSATQPITFGTVPPGTASQPSAAVTLTNSQTKTTEANGKTFASILYGAAKITIPADPKKVWQQQTDHTGVVLLGKDAALFELVGEHVVDGGLSATLIGSDGQPGLTGGETPESQAVSVRFKGAPRPGHYVATLRVVTQAGNTGKVSDGAAGKPLAGLYYVDIPVQVDVE